MGVNKAKMRRERKSVEKKRIKQQVGPEQGKPIKPWVMRLIMMVPPVLYACYLVWDMYNQ